MKETFFFSHDYNARNDRKMLRLKVNLKMCGVGIYWSLIEMLYEESGELFLSDIDVIADELRTDPDKVLSVVKDFELFKNDGEKFWSESVLSRLEKRQEKSKNASLNAKKRWEDANAMRSHSKRNAIKESKVKESKGQDSKEELEKNPDDKIISLPQILEAEKKEKEKSCAQKEKCLLILAQSGINPLNPLYESTWLILWDQPHFKGKPAAVMEMLARNLRDYDEDYAIKLMEKAITGNYKTVVWEDTKQKYLEFKNRQNGIKPIYSRENNTRVSTQPGKAFGKL